MRCMNPFVLRRGDEYWMFYAGGDSKDGLRICLATAPVDDVSPGAWVKHGPLFERGPEGSFDDQWCVLPCVHRIGGRWHLYYTGRRGRDWTRGLQSFAGVGLAVSDDLRHWTRFSDQPVLEGDGWEHRGVAGGGGRILEIPQPDGRILYRLYGTLATGTPSSDLLVNQSKYSVVAHSFDGLDWFDKRIVLNPRLEADYENAATIALNVWKTDSEYRAIYAGIGTRFGAYSLCEAASRDGLRWERGKPGENLCLTPSGEGWESKMVEYPNVIEENGKLRLFYCGNGYGTTGIGTAVAEKLE